MHPSALELGQLLFETHGSDVRRVLDIGSLDINGSLRDVCPSNVDYVGIDLEAGKGVDMVLDDPYIYPFPDNSFDMLVSTSCFEHDPMFWLTFLEMLRVVRDQGIIYINAPSNGAYHTHPWDNWRFYPDASHALEMWGRRSGISVSAIESFIMSRCGPWNDYVMIFQKGTPNPERAKFISDRLHGLKNLRKITNPDEILFRIDKTDDLLHMEQLHARISQLEAELATQSKF